ncbi:MAG: flavodoxin family protein [Armatimonadetes bacterium]|nr:flavodoxin family protein [Armatimonadota bacterium]
MARVLTVLCSRRKKGFTAGLLRAAVEGIERVGGVAAEVVHAFDHDFGPCKSCFGCIRDPNHLCVQSDAFGHTGELSSKVSSCNGLLMVDAVHFWGPTAMCHTFVERLYPFLWSGKLNGLPFASISCASNQGMQHLATQNICKWAFALGARYVGGLPAHTAYYQRAIREAETLGKELAETALEEEQHGRKPYASDEDKWLDYEASPWQPLLPYLDNLTFGTLDAGSSIIARSLNEATFDRPEAVEMLEKALPLLTQALDCHKAGDAEQATRHLVAASALWTHATWKEFLEEDVIGARQPEAYRPLPQSA